MRHLHQLHIPFALIAAILLPSSLLSAQNIPAFSRHADQYVKRLHTLQQPSMPIHSGDTALQDSVSPYRRPKVALVLSGGGAKGCAHVGVLKALEQFNIPVDMIVGTSMGALIGGLYCIGYSADQIDSLLEVQDWEQLLFDKQDPDVTSLSQRRLANKYFYAMTVEDWQTMRFSSQGLVKGNNLSNLFAQLTMGFHDSICFDSLPIPFTCVATDLVHDRQIDFHSGTLATAMRASMAIPGVFSPVIIDDMVLVDGGMKDNFPVDLARQQGADIIIGISVKNDRVRTADDFRGTRNVLGTIIEGLTEAKYRENVPLADMFVHVNVEGFSPMSFNKPAIDTLVERGYSAMIGQLEQLMDIKKQVDPYNLYKFSDLPRRTIIKSTDRLPLKQIYMKNVYSFDSSRLSRRFHILNKDSITINEIEKIVGTLRNNLYYVYPTYTLLPYHPSSLRLPAPADTGYGYSLSLTTNGKQAAVMYLGVRYDNIENVAMMLHGIIPLHWSHAPFVLEPTLRLGTNQEVRVAASLSPFTMGRMQLSYSYQHREFNIYYEGDRAYNADFNMHEIDFGMKDSGRKNILFDFFMRLDIANRDELLLLRTNPLNLESVLNHALISYHVNMHYNNQNHSRLATRGMDFQAGYSAYTDNFYQYQSATPIHAVRMRLRNAFPLTHRLTLEPMLYSRIVKGNSIPVLLRNYVGGEYFGHLMEQVMPFVGISHTETLGHYFLGSEVEFRYTPIRNHYFIAAAAAGIHHDDFYQILNNKPLLGLQVAYYYTTLIGPFCLCINYSNVSRLSLYLNIGFEF